VRTPELLGRSTHIAACAHCSMQLALQRSC
jgi:hypothetical protein